jgi:hypothetical protein
MTDLVKPYELTDAELDVVAAGQARGVAFAAGLIAAAVGAGVNIENIANNNNIDIDVDALNNVLNGSNVTVGAIVNVLGGPAILRQLSNALP